MVKANKNQFVDFMLRFAGLSILLLVKDIFDIFRSKTYFKNVIVNKFFLCIKAYMILIFSRHLNVKYLTQSKIGFVIR